MLAQCIESWVMMMFYHEYHLFDKHLIFVYQTLMFIFSDDYIGTETYSKSLQLAFGNNFAYCFCFLLPELCISID